MAVFPRAETDPTYTAGGATDAEVAAAIADVNDAIDARADADTADTAANLAAAVATLGGLIAAKQDSTTAATDAELAAAIAAHAAGDASDAELAAAVASLTSAIGLKQDASTAATDTEVESVRATLAAADSAESAARAAAVSAEAASRAAADALKQDASTAATDAELASGLASVFATAPAGQMVAGFDSPRHYTGTKPIVITTNCAVISDPGENGHIYFETSPDNVNWTSFQKLSYVPCRNRVENLGQIGSGGMIWGVVLPGHWWRYRTYTAVGFATPDFVFDGAFEWIYQVVP